MINLDGIKSFVCKPGRPLGVTILGYSEILICLGIFGQAIYISFKHPIEALVMIFSLLIASILPIFWLIGAKWSWYLKVILSSLSILGSLIKLNIAGIIIPSIIIVYCFRKNVRLYFKISQENVSELNQSTDTPSAS